MLSTSPTEGYGVKITVQIAVVVINVIAITIKKTPDNRNTPPTPS